MARRSTRSVRRNRTDYTFLLLELQKPRMQSYDSGAAPARPVKCKTKPAPAAPTISAFRQRLMSDEHILFFYSKAGGAIHDKTCRAARRIPDAELCWSGTYRPELAPCPDCRQRAYLRLGARDASRTAAYERLFEKMGFSAELLHRMYVHSGIRTEIVGQDRLMLWGSEDTWVLELVPCRTQGHLRLMHNNYCALPDGTRRFTSGFHVQTSSTTATRAVSRIAHYTYEEHKLSMAKWKNARLRSKPAAAPTPPRPSIWRRLWNWLRALWGKKATDKP